MKAAKREKIKLNWPWKWAHCFERDVLERLMSCFHSIFVREDSGTTQAPKDKKLIIILFNNQQKIFPERDLISDEICSKVAWTLRTEWNYSIRFVSGWLSFAHKNDGKRINDGKMFET